IRACATADPTKPEAPVTRTLSLATTPESPLKFPKPGYAPRLADTIMQSCGLGNPLAITNISDLT
ncbi:MAG: hypothetical protein ACRED2_05605, partial [Methylocella sp.]